MSPGHTWNDSRLICRRYGGDLVKLETENETALISGFFQNPKIKYNHYWIGKQLFFLKVLQNIFQLITTIENLEGFLEN